MNNTKKAPRRPPSKTHLGIRLDELAIGTLGGGLLGEESIVECVGNLDTAEVHGAGGGDDVGLVDTSQRNTVQVVWAWQHS